ncbi:Alg14-domain-containing protein [Thozetella sp. PMI_491]|nr:Alg14-domain-containing protein [Thozetella sp. PMI_491]
MEDFLAVMPLSKWLSLAVVFTLTLISPFIFGVVAAFAIDVTLGIGFLSFILYRIWRLTSDRPHVQPAWSRRSPDLSGFPGVYWMYILGSGGHTTEMIETIKASLHVSPNTHRRYVVTTGDLHSGQAAERLEQAIRLQVGAQGGTSDLIQIRRARDVHQSLVSAVIPALVSVWEAFVALTRTPTKRSAPRDVDAFRYPSVIVTNGPGTGFIVAWLAFMLKVIYIIPETKCKVIYIETWAHVRSLSLTGRIFHTLKIADLFCVQHRELAVKLGKVYLPVVLMPQPQPID